MSLYLTDKIYIKNDIFYYEKDGKSYKLQDKNWHIHLNEYGWEKLNKQWIIQLNRSTKKRKKNSLFGALDCGGEGDCLFHCINYAIYGDLNTENLRFNLSEMVTEERFNDMIHIYQILKIDGDFNEEWDPDNITYDDFKRILSEGGDNYWGDFLVLNLLKEYLNINFIVLYSNDISGEYYHYPIFYKYNEGIDTVILLYENENHFKLVGYFNNHRMITRFSNENLPEEIVNMIQK